MCRLLFAIKVVNFEINFLGYVVEWLAECLFCYSNLEILDFFSWKKKFEPCGIFGGKISEHVEFLSVKSSNFYQEVKKLEIKNAPYTNFFTCDFLTCFILTSSLKLEFFKFYCWLSCAAALLLFFNYFRINFLDLVKLKFIECRM